MKKRKITYRIEISYSLHLLIVLTLSQSGQSIRIQLTTGWVQLLPVILAEFCSK